MVMIPNLPSYEFSFNKKFLILLVSITILLSGWLVTPLVHAGADQTFSDIPTLDAAVKIAQERQRSKNSSYGDLSKNQMAGKVKDFYYQIQYQREKLKISKEVEGHFEKALKGATEKFEKGEGEVEQKDLTMLKLGLAGTSNDVIQLESGLAIARVSLGDLLGREFSPESKIAEEHISPLEFKLDTLDEYMKYRRSPRAKQASDSKTYSDLDIKKAFIRVKEKQGVMKLAAGNRKITRALLVTEVANYDFGIGSSGDLFEALIIYTRVLSGYYESIYKFNLAVVALEEME